MNVPHAAPPLPLPLPDPPLADGELWLRPWRQDDADQLLAAWRDPEIARWTGAPSHPTADLARRWIEGEGARRDRGLAIDLAVCVGDRLVGEVGLTRFDRRRRIAELGWWIADQERGNGYASRAVRSVAAWAVTELFVDRVYARVSPANPASVGVARAAGLEPRGRASGGFEVWATELRRAGARPVGATIRS